jgi:hypothetical protein
MKVIDAKPVEDNQADRFKPTARNLECDLDEVRWKDKLRKVMKPKPFEKFEKKA